MRPTIFDSILHGDKIDSIKSMGYDPDHITVFYRVTPSIIKKVLTTYLNGKLDAKALQMWADFLCFREEYVAPEHEDEDHYEAMWYVLQRISTPFIDGAITPARIKSYLSELEANYQCDCD